jgi:Cyclin, C-terminal domain
LTKKQYDLALYFLHLLEQNYNMVHHNSSAKAAAALLLVGKMIRIDGVSLDVLVQDFTATPEVVKEISMQLFLQICAPANEKLSAIRRKFSLECFSQVALLKVHLKPFA